MSGKATDTAAPAVPLDALRFPLQGSRLIEASAGTGKTYTIASLYVRLVLGHGDLPGQRALTPPEILVVTFTRAATQELRDRIRRRLTDAADCFLGVGDADDFLTQLRDSYPVERWPACARLLQIAAEWMDDAAVSTIDAWCYRMLREHAFDSAGLFDVEMDVDPGERVVEATRDYWRLFIAPLPPAELGLVLDAIAAQERDKRNAVGCDMLADRLYKRWLRHVGHLGVPPEPREALARRRALRDACKAQWREWVPELRNLLQAASDKNLFHKANLKSNHWTGWLNNLEEWAGDENAGAPFNASSKAWTRLTPEGLAEVWKDGKPPQHPAITAMAGLRREIADWDSEAARILPHAACWVAGRVAELRRQHAMLDFNGLLEQLDAALSGPNGTKLARMLREQFPAALIDEFQDTNPIQYRIFDRIYDVDSNNESALLALIGDPKQAIYRFRGADIHAYLDARLGCAGRLYTLDSNYRSSAAMVAAVNHIFLAAEQQQERGAFLFRERGGGANPVPFMPVRAAADPGVWLVDDAPAPALTIWSDPGPDNPPDARAVARACASEILRLLQLAAEGRAGFRCRGEFTPLCAGDMAILVNNGYEARYLRAQLAQRGIRSVYLSEDASVYHGAAARDVLAWLRACAEPERDGYVRAALATASVGLAWDRLDALVRDENEWEDMLARFAAYREHWRRRGVLPMLRRFMHDFDVPARLFAAQEEEAADGERRLTDLLHLAELLQSAAARLDGEHAVIRHLEEHMDAGSVAPVDEDPARMRLESDAGLVQIVTVHKSKGLEYPLVFCPYAYAARPARSLELPAAYRDRDGGYRVLANAADADATHEAWILADLEKERLAEDLRKLYVALTRARHATWVTLPPVTGLADSAAGYLLGGAPACSPDALPATIDALANECPDIRVLPLPEPCDERYRPSDEPVSANVWRRMGRRLEQRWNMSSYSALSRLAMELPENAPGLRPDVAALALPDEPRMDAYLEAYVAEAEDVSENSADACGPSRGPAATPAEGIHDFPRGAAPGSFLHGLLEWVFAQGPANVLGDPEGLRAVVDRRCRSRGWEKHVDAVTAWLQRFFTQRFRLPGRAGEEAGPLVLAELDTALPEMEFWFGVDNADLPALDALVAAFFLPGLPRPTITRGQLNGMLRGFIDLAFEHDGRYYVADYKSNRLGPTDLDYDDAAIAGAILKHRYDLQAAIYLFALHRLLKSRLGDAYDYERHVGGALVFFMRGLGAPGQGLFMARPGRELLEALEQVFEGMESGVHA